MNRPDLPDYGVYLHTGGTDVGAGPTLKTVIYGLDQFGRILAVAQGLCKEPVFPPWGKAFMSGYVIDRTY